MNVRMTYGGRWRFVLPNAENICRLKKSRSFIIDVFHADDDQRRPGSRHRTAAVGRQNRKPEAIIALTIDGHVRADDAALIDVEQRGDVAWNTIMYSGVVARVPVGRCHLTWYNVCR